MSLHGSIGLAVSGAVALLSLSSCNGILGDIYDLPTDGEQVDFGFVSVDETTRTGRIYLNATSYTEWHYVDLHARRVESVAVGAAAPAAWDFAVHRYDAKTHGGAVAESPSGDFAALPDVGSLPADRFVADEWTTDRIAVDMSQMMEGTIRYAEDYRNPVLSRWLDVDTSVMPPIYTLSGRIYLLRLPDGSCAALRLSNFMNDAAVKGYLTIDYRYPVEP